MQNILKIQPIKVKEYEAMQSKYNMVPNLPEKGTQLLVIYHRKAYRFWSST